MDNVPVTHRVHRPNGDLYIGRITSDGAALITFRLAPGEVPVHPPATAGERLVEYLLRQEREAKAKADPADEVLGAKIEVI